MIRPRCIGLLLSLAPILTFAQGQDSTTWARDKMVIAEMLPGVYSNTNQVYFDTRTGRPEEQRRGPVVVAVTAAEGEADTFTVSRIVESRRRARLGGVLTSRTG